MTLDFKKEIKSRRISTQASEVPLTKLEKIKLKAKQKYFEKMQKLSARFGHSDPNASVDGAFSFGEPSGEVILEREESQESSIIEVNMNELEDMRFKARARYDNDHNAYGLNA